MMILAIRMITLAGRMLRLSHPRHLSRRNTFAHKWIGVRDYGGANPEDVGLWPWTYLNLIQDSRKIGRIWGRIRGNTLHVREVFRKSDT